MNDHVLKLVEAGLIKKALEEMIPHGLHKIECTELLSRFSQNERAFKKGYVTSEVYRIEKIKITDILIEILNREETEKNKGDSLPFALLLQRQKAKNVESQIKIEMERLNAINRDLKKENDEERKVSLNIRIKEKEKDIDDLMKQLKEINNNI